MLLRFNKMHGLGNDFMVVDLVTQHFVFRPELVRQLADRNFGIGFDQLLIVEPPSDPDMDFRYRIFNADGSEVQQCGNGARCFMRFVHDVRLTAKQSINVETKSGPIVLSLEQDGEVVVNMGPPRFEPKDLPMDKPARAKKYQLEVPLNEGSTVVEFGAVSMGNPHAVILVDDVNSELVNQLGPKLENHPLFPERVNVGFMQIDNRGEITLRVYERGAGWTLACGTGACAAMAMARDWNLVDDVARVHLPGGTLTIRWPGEGPVFMKGPATRVFEGRIPV